MIDLAAPKPLVFVGNSGKNLRRFPKSVRAVIGQGLWAAQLGKMHPDAKPLKGFRGAAIVEIVVDDRGDTYRGVYTVKMAGIIYVLHAFQKKSKSGIKTPQREIELIKRRLKTAEEHFRQPNA